MHAVGLILAMLVPAAPVEQPVYAGGRLGMLAMESGATTRAPALEGALWARWALGGWFGPAVSYRLGWRDAGGETVGMTTYVHRLQLGLFAEGNHGRAVFGAELGVHGRLDSIDWHAGGESVRTSRR